MVRKLRVMIVVLIATVMVAITLVGCSAASKGGSDDSSKNLCYIMASKDYYDYLTYLEESYKSDSSKKTIPEDYKPVVAESLTMGETYFVVCYTKASTADGSNVEFKDGAVRISVEDDGVNIGDALEVDGYGGATGNLRGASIGLQEQTDTAMIYNVTPYGESDKAEFLTYVEFTAKSEAKVSASYYIGSTVKKNKFGISNTSTASASIYFEKKIQLSNLEIAYLTSDTYVDGRYETSALTENVAMKVGKEYYMVITATMKSLITESTNDKMKLNVKLSPLAVADGTLEEAGSGNFTETTNAEKTEKNISVMFKIPEPEEGDKAIRFIVRITPVSLGNPSVEISFSGEQISVVGVGRKTQKTLTIDGEEKTSEGFEYRLSADKTYYVLESIGIAKGSILLIPAEYDGKPVKEIDPQAFSGNRQIKSVEVSEGIEIIGSRAFKGCPNLLKVSFPSTATLGQYVLEGSTSVTSLTANLGGARLTSLFGTSSTLPVALKNVTLKGDTQLCDNAFSGGGKLESIMLPSTLTAIGSSVFSSCSSLSSLAFDADNQSFYIQSGILYAKSNNKILGSVAYFSGEMSYPDGLTEIPGGDMSGVTKITVQNTVTRFSSNVKNLAPTEASGPYFLFQNITKTNLVKATVTTGTNAPSFGGATKLISVTLPSNMTGVPSSTFSGCESLTTVTLPSKIDIINAKLFYNCKSLTSIVIPESVMTIGEDAFYGCESLTEIKIPSGVTLINPQAFAYCKKLTEVTLPDIGSTIPRYLFDGCESLTKVNFTGEIKYLHDGLFRNCKSMTSFTIPDTVLNISNLAFAGTGLTKINIPASVNFIDSNVFSNCKSLTEFTVEAGNDDFSASGGILYNAGATKIIKVPEGITGKVTLSTKIKAIRASAFSGCDKMTELVLRSSVCIEPGALSSCTALTKIHFDSNKVLTYTLQKNQYQYVDVSNPSKAATLVKGTSDKYFGNPDLLKEG